MVRQRSCAIVQVSLHSHPQSIQPSNHRMGNTRASIGSTFPPSPALPPRSSVVVRGRLDDCERTPGRGTLTFERAFQYIIFSLSLLCVSLSIISTYLISSSYPTMVRIVHRYQQEQREREQQQLLAAQGGLAKVRGLRACVSIAYLFHRPPLLTTHTHTHTHTHTLIVDNAHLTEPLPAITAQLESLSEAVQHEPEQQQPPVRCQPDRTGEPLDGEDGWASVTRVLISSLVTVSTTTAT